MPAQIVALPLVLTTLVYGVWLVYAIGKLRADRGAENTGQAGW
ncbi:hypothetical protein AB0L63_22585 [Nocardia sp. NPDC051990]